MRITTNLVDHLKNNPEAGRLAQYASPLSELH